MNDTLITVIGTLSGVILGFLLQFLYIFIIEKRTIRNELKFSITDIFYCKRKEFFIPKLFNLRQIFLKNPDYLKYSTNKTFFDNWLNDFNVINYEYDKSLIDSSWDLKKIEKLKSDINTITFKTFDEFYEK